MSMQERLTQFLKDSSDWERKSTSIQGVFLLKLPSLKVGTWKDRSNSWSTAPRVVLTEIGFVNVAIDGSRIVTIKGTV